MRYICGMCGYIYDEAKEKVPFKDLPEDWTCPLCGAPKSEFSPLDEEEKKTNEVVKDEEPKDAEPKEETPTEEAPKDEVKAEDKPKDAKKDKKDKGKKVDKEDKEDNAEKDDEGNDEEVKDTEGKDEEPKKVKAPKVKIDLGIEDEDFQLDAGELAAVMSNLARSCEKQYMFPEMDLFNELATYFDSLVPMKENPKVEKILKKLQENVDDYPALRKTSDDHHDRGAARAIVWTQKVTTMLNTIMDRYLNEGDAFLKDTPIWMCTVCGFIYIGKEPPVLCPVCKVPSWKFTEIKGREAK